MPVCQSIPNLIPESVVSLFMKDKYSPILCQILSSLLQMLCLLPCGTLTHPALWTSPNNYSPAVTLSATLKRAKYNCGGDTFLLWKIVFSSSMLALFWLQKPVFSILSQSMNAGVLGLFFQVFTSVCIFRGIQYNNPVTLACLANLV